MRGAVALIPLGILGCYAWYLSSIAPARTLDGARGLAISARQYGQNWVRPGCGVGREDATRARDRLRHTLHLKPEFIPPLLVDPDSKVRAAVVLSIGWERQTQFAPDIATCFQSEKDAKVREYMIASLARLGGKDALQGLHRGLDDTDTRNRSLATAALLHLGDEIPKEKRIEITKAASQEGQPTPEDLRNVFD